MATIVASPLNNGAMCSKWRKMQPWVVVLTASLYFFFEFMQVNMFNALNPALFHTFGATSLELGHLSANYFYADVLLLLPAGIILDRVSTRRVILCAMALCVLSTFGFSQAQALWQAEVCRFVTGLCGAFCLLSSVRLASRWFPPRRMALVIGLIVTMAMVGGMLAQTPFTLLIEHFGWREALIFDALMGVVIWFIIFLVVRDYPEEDAAQVLEQQHGLQEMGLLQGILCTIKNGQNWLAGLYASLVNLPIFLLGATWGSLYLMQIHKLTHDESSYVTSMIFVGMIIGSPLFGWISDTMRNRKQPMIIGAALALGAILWIMYGSHLSIVQLMILFFVLGLLVGSQIIAFPLVAESNSPALTGTAEGLASVLIMAGGFTEPLFARFADWHWSHSVIDKIPVYSLHDYRTAFLMMPIAFILALLASFLIKETRCRAFQE